MLRMLRKNSKGFTLVEVIVVAVIVAVLALVAVQLYQGYVREARQNTAENLAASASSFAQSALNSVTTFTAANLAANATWSITLPSGQNATFTCPRNASITIAGDSLTATVGDRTSGYYRFKVAN